MNNISFKNIQLLGVTSIAVAVTGIGAFSVHYVTNHHKRFLRQFQLHDDRIDEKLIYPKQGKEETNRIYFNQVDRIIVGAFTETSFSVIKKKLMQMFQPSKYFSLLIVVYQGNYFLKKIASTNEMDQWMDKFKQADLPVYYTEKDLGLAYLGYEKDIDIYFEEAGDTLLLDEQKSVTVDQHIKGTKRTAWIPEGLSNYWAGNHKKVRAITAALLLLVCIPMIYIEENDLDDAGTAIFMGILLIPILALVCRKLAGWKDLVYIYVATCLGGTIGGVIFYFILEDMDPAMILFPWLFVGMIAVLWLAFFLIAKLIWYVLRKLE